MQIYWKLKPTTSDSQQETWPVSSPSCWRTQRQCRASQSYASGWSYSPGPSPCRDSLTTNNHTCTRAVSPSHHGQTLNPSVLQSSSNIVVPFFFLFFNNVAMETSIVSKQCQNLKKSYISLIIIIIIIIR